MAADKSVILRQKYIKKADMAADKSVIVRHKSALLSTGDHSSGPGKEDSVF
jgi:hypothetical protein